MANVVGINLGSVSVRDLAVSKNASPVSADSTKAFEQFLSGGNSTQKKEVEVNSSKNLSASQDTSLEQPVNYSRRDDLAAEQTDAMNHVEADVANSTLENGKATELQEGIRDIVKENLSTDDDTVDAMLQMMGIGLMDLLNPDTLQQFVLLVNGGKESTDFLTDESLLQSFMNLSQALEDFCEENANSLLSFMETLDTPVELDEFLQQQGLSEQFVESQETAENAEDILESVIISKNPDGQEQIAVGETVSDTQKEASAEPADLSQSEKTVAESVVAKQNVGQDSGEHAQDSSLKEEFTEDSSELLYSQKQDSAETEQITTPLFAEQMNGLQEDLTNVWKPEMNGVQKMQQMVDIVNQVSQQIRSSVHADTTTMEMQLNPERLGKVYFSVVSKAGVMTATFQVQSEEAKQALESQMLTLRENLEAKNLKVESVDVQISDFSFTQKDETQNQNQSASTNQGKRKFRYDTEEPENVEEVSGEAVRRQVMRDSGGSIDFTA